MTEPTPIRADIEPTLDANRELVDYCIIRLQQHLKTCGEPADTVVIVTEGPNGRIAHSFSLRTQDRAATCGAAAAILLQRAVS